MALTAKCTTPAVLPVAEIDDNDDLDNDLDNDLGGDADEVRPMDNDLGDLHSPITDEKCLDMAAETRLILEMLLEHQAQWKDSHRLEWERKMVEGECLATEPEQWAGKCTKCAK